jgi:predicted RNA binding protein YcfA (HicA-like mRNA interferase family)
MAGQLPVITAEQLRRALRRGGWEEIRQSGSHLRLRHPDYNEDVTIAMHSGDIPTGTLRAIVRQLGMSIDEFRELMR